jgi:hypothetical protein
MSTGEMADGSESSHEDKGSNDVPDIKVAIPEILTEGIVQVGRL